MQLQIRNQPGSKLRMIGPILWGVLLIGGVIVLNLRSYFRGDSVPVVTEVAQVAAADIESVESTTLPPVTKVKATSPEQIATTLASDSEPGEATEDQPPNANDAGVSGQPEGDHKSEPDSELASELDAANIIEASIDDSYELPEFANEPDDTSELPEFANEPDVTSDRLVTKATDEAADTDDYLATTTPLEMSSEGHEELSSHKDATQAGALDTESDEYGSSIELPFSKFAETSNIHDAPADSESLGLPTSSTSSQAHVEDSEEQFTSLESSEQFLDEPSEDETEQTAETTPPFDSRQGTIADENIATEQLAESKSEQLKDEQLEEAPSTSGHTKSAPTSLALEQQSMSENTDLSRENDGGTSTESPPVRSNAATTLPVANFTARNTPEIRITNINEFSIAVNFIQGGDTYRLESGQRFVLPTPTPISVRFDRGGSFGETTATLRPGWYDFQVSGEAGWRLVPSEKQPVR